MTGRDSGTRKKATRCRTSRGGEHLGKRRCKVFSRQQTQSPCRGWKSNSTMFGLETTKKRNQGGSQKKLESWVCREWQKSNPRSFYQSGNKSLVKLNKKLHPGSSSPYSLTLGKKSRVCRRKGKMRPANKGKNQTEFVHRRGSRGPKGQTPKGKAQVQVPATRHKSKGGLLKNPPSLGEEGLPRGRVSGGEGGQPARLRGDKSARGVENLSWGKKRGKGRQSNHQAWGKGNKEYVRKTPGGSPRTRSNYTWKKQGNDRCENEKGKSIRKFVTLGGKDYPPKGCKGCHREGSL